MNIPQREQPQNAKSLKKIVRTDWRRRSIEQWLKVGKSERERVKRGSLKTRHKKLKFSGKPKGHIIGALTPLVKTRHVATMRVTPPLRIKCGMKPQEPCLVIEPFIFWWSSWHTTMITKLRGQLMGLTKPSSLDGLIKYTRPPWLNTDEHRQVINKSIK